MRLHDTERLRAHVENMTFARRKAGGQAHARRNAIFSRPAAQLEREWGPWTPPSAAPRAAAIVAAPSPIAAPGHLSPPLAAVQEECWQPADLATNCWLRLPPELQQYIASFLPPANDSRSLPPTRANFRATCRLAKTLIDSDEATQSSLVSARMARMVRLGQGGLSPDDIVDLSTLSSLWLGDLPLGGSQWAQQACVAILDRAPCIEQLSLRNAGLGAQGSALACIFRGRHGLRELDLSGNSLNQAGGGFANALTELLDLEVIDLSDNGFGDSIGLFVRALALLPSLHTLKVGDNPVGSAHMPSFAKQLSRCQSVRTLHVNNIQLTNENSALLACSLVALDSLQVVCTEDNPLDHGSLMRHANLLGQPKWHLAICLAATNKKRLPAGRRATAAPLAAGQ